MEFSVSVLDYMGKINKGVLALISIVYNKKYYESTFYYTDTDILLTPSEELEIEIGDITKHPDYINLLREILKKIAPYQEVYKTLKQI